MTIFHLPFHTWLKNRRRALDISVDELASRVGYSPNTLRKLENGDRRPSRQLAERLAQQLQIASEEFSTFLDYARAGISASAPAQYIPSLPTKPNMPRRAAPTRPLTRLIGRAKVLHEVQNLLLQHAPILVTLLGPGGVGKTRLAQELATDLHPQFADGALVVSLAAIEEPQAAMIALAQALDLAPDLHRPAATILRDALCDRQLLLVLDNLEQVVDLSTDIANFLLECPQLRILTTSRVALRVRGEQVVPVPPLELPLETELADPEQLVAIPAITLFVERVQSVAPQFTLNASNGPAVAAICARLDGLPLAIELVAARCKLLGPQHLLTQLQSAEAGRLFDLLGSGTRDMPARHRTLGAAIDWSYHLLNDAEQRLLRRLACFVGGWSLSAAEAIDSADPSHLACPRNQNDTAVSPEFLNRFTVLCDSSLVQELNPGGDEPRFTMLTTLREYGLEQLALHGELEAIRRLHAQYFLALVGTGEPDPYRRQQASRFDQLERERANLQVALATFAEFDPATGLELAGRLWWFWYQYSYWLEGRDWLLALLKRGESAAAPTVLAEAMLGLGALSFVLADYAAARTYCSQSADRFRTLADRHGLGHALTFLGMTILRQGGTAQARVVLEVSIAEFRSINDPWGLAHALNGLRQALVELGDLIHARRIQEESLQLWREVHNPWGLALALNGLGEIARYEHDFQQAARLYAESLRLFQASNDSGNSAILLHNLAHATLACGEASRAADLFRQGLQLDYKQGNSVGMIEHLAGLGAVAAAQGQWQRAATLLGYVVSVESNQRENFFPIDQEVLLAAITQVESALGAGAVSKTGTGLANVSASEMVAYGLC